MNRAVCINRKYWLRDEENEGGTIDPAEIEKIANSGNKLCLDDLNKLASTLRCWKAECWEYGSFFICQNCGRGYHRGCVFSLGTNYPEPVFDAETTEAETADFGKVTLTECPVCRILNEPECPDESDVEDLNVELQKLTIKMKRSDKFGKFMTACQGMNFERHFQPIVDKMESMSYKSMDQFMIDVREIQYRAATLFHAAGAEFWNLIKFFEEMDAYWTILKNCKKCFDTLVGPDGRLSLDCQEFKLTMLDPCEKPHLILWVKEPELVYYPVKVIAVRDDFVYFIPFRWPAGRRLQLKSSGADFQEYSTELPPDGTVDEKAKSEKFQKEWDASCKDADTYWRNVCAKVGIGRQRLQEDPLPFDGNYNAALERLY